MTALEMTGIVDEHHQLRLDGELPLTGPLPVKVILLYSELVEDEKLEEEEWLRAAARNPAFADLADPEEDIYSPLDGVPFCDQV